MYEKGSRRTGQPGRRLTNKHMFIWKLLFSIKSSRFMGTFERIKQTKAAKKKKKVLVKLQTSANTCFTKDCAESNTILFCNNDIPTAPSSYSLLCFTPSGHKEWSAAFLHHKVQPKPHVEPYSYYNSLSFLLPEERPMPYVEDAVAGFDCSWMVGCNIDTAVVSLPFKLNCSIIYPHFFPVQNQQLSLIVLH